MQRCQMHKAPQKARDLHPSLINQQQLKAISESFLLNLVNGVRSSSDRRPFWDEWELNSLDRRGKSRNSIWVIVATGAASLFVNCLGGNFVQIWRSSVVWNKNTSWWLCKLFGGNAPEMRSLEGYKLYQHSAFQSAWKESCFAPELLHLSSISEKIRLMLPCLLA